MENNLNNNINNIDLYDKITNACIINIYSLSKEKEGIYLSDLNIKDKKDLFFFENARIVSQHILQKPLYIKCNPLKYLKFKKLYKKIKWIHKKIETLNAQEILNFMSKEFLTTNEIYEKIYEEYYERKDIE